MGTRRHRPGARRRKPERKPSSPPRGAREPENRGTPPGGGPPGWAEPEESEPYQGPVNLSELRADDELLSALARGEEVPVVGESFREHDEVVCLLRDWRRSVDSEPTPELVDIDLAMAVLSGAEQRARVRRKRPVLTPVAGAAAGLVVAVGALAGVARTAQPGGALWGVSKVLYAHHARSVLATDFIRHHLRHARAAIRSGHDQQALGDMSAISRHFPAVQNSTDKDSLVAAWRKMEDELDRMPPGPDKPSARQRAEATQPLPAGSGSTSASTTESTAGSARTSTSPAASARPGTAHRTSSTSSSGSSSSKPTTQSGGSGSSSSKPTTQSGGSGSSSSKPTAQSGSSGSSSSKPTEHSGGSGSSSSKPRGSVSHSEAAPSSQPPMTTQH